MKGDEELLDTVEQIRKAKFPDVPADLVQKLLLIEANYTENRVEAYRRIEKAIDAYLEKQAAAKEAGD
jgi:hypothetical protein